MFRLLMIGSSDVGSKVVVNCVNGVAIIVAAAAAIAACDAADDWTVVDAIIGVTDASVVVGIGSRLNRLAITWAGGTAIGMW